MHLVLSRVPNCDLVIVPSTRDLTHLLPMPQAPFQCSSVAIFAPNPCYISANDYRICISTADIVKEICTGSCFRASHPINRIKQAFNELLEQRSLHPFCPTATPVDFQLLESMQLPDSPDVLIVPSRMACLVDFVGDTLCANPGSLAKDTEAGVI